MSAMGTERSDRRLRMLAVETCAFKKINLPKNCSNSISCESPNEWTTSVRLLRTAEMYGIICK